MFRLITVFFVCLALISAGCSGGGQDAAFGDDDDDFAAPEATPPEASTNHKDAEERELVESDLYKLVGDTLYVYNYTEGLYAIDVSDETTPTVQSHLDVFGPAGEIYADQNQIFLLLEEASTHCDECDGLPVAYDGSELVGISDGPNGLEIQSRTCMPGQVVASRMLGDILYSVTNDSIINKSYAVSIDLRDPTAPLAADLLELSGEAHEIHMNDQALFVAQPVEQNTALAYIDISSPQGLMVAQGVVDIPGIPLGRFHMDAMDTTFRIVTFDTYQWSTSLHVVDISDSQNLTVIGSLDHIGPDEEIKATRFVDNRAYVVTFRETDPLWVISLDDPTQPYIMGELWVPGWSDFIFPRGEELLTVGRGEWGGVAVQLFDISDPQHPTQTAVVEVGDWSSTSEALADFRGVRTIEAGEHCDTTLVTIPTSTLAWDEQAGDYACQDRLHLVDLYPGALVGRGEIAANGTIRRSLPIKTHLFSISDLEISSIDIANRDAPVAITTLDVGNPDLASDGCLEGWEDWGGGGMPPGDDVWDDEWEGDWGDDDYMFGCHVGTHGSHSRPAWLALFGLLALALIARRRLFARA